MKKSVLALGLGLILLLGTVPAFGQYYAPPPPPGTYCDPYYYQCYYSAPYSNPLDQFFYYTVPEIGHEMEERHERREYREHREHEGNEHERGSERR